MAQKHKQQIQFTVLCSLLLFHFSYLTKISYVLNIGKYLVQLWMVPWTSTTSKIRLFVTLVNDFQLLTYASFLLFLDRIVTYHAWYTQVLVTSPQFIHSRSQRTRHGPKRCYQKSWHTKTLTSMIFSENDIVKHIQQSLVFFFIASFLKEIRNLCIANTWLQWVLFPGISVVSINLVEEAAQIEEPKEIFLVQFEFNL